MTHTSPPLWKQLLGAGAGALIAFAVYGIYEGVVPPLEAYLVPKATLDKETLANRRFVPSDTQARFDRIAKKTRAMVEEFETERDVRALEAELSNIVSTTKTSPPPPASSPDEAQDTHSTVSDEGVIADESELPEEFPATLPQSGGGMMLGLLAASAGGILALMRRKKTA